MSIRPWKFSRARADVLTKRRGKFACRREKRSVIRSALERERETLYVRMLYICVYIHDGDRGGKMLFINHGVRGQEIFRYQQTDIDSASLIKLSIYECK